MSNSPPHIGYRALLHLAWPMVVARSSQAVIGFCDALMTTSLGEAKLAAVTTGSMNAFFVIIFPMGVVFIVQSFAAQLYAQEKVATALRYAWYALGLSGLAGLLSVASIPGIPPAQSLGLRGRGAGANDRLSDHPSV